MGTDSAGGRKKKVMNAKKWFLALSVTLAGLQGAAAQEKKQESPKAEEPVKIELPSDNIIRHFRSRNSGTAVVDWYQLKDGRNTYVIGYYSTDGDQRKVVYRNGAYFCTETEVPIEYCPARIRAAVDTLAPGLKLKELYYEYTYRNKGYRAVMKKGRGKKAQVRDLMFSIQGDFMREEDASKVIRGF